MQLFVFEQGVHASAFLQAVYAVRAVEQQRCAERKRKGAPLGRQLAVLSYICRFEGDHLIPRPRQGHRSRLIGRQLVNAPLIVIPLQEAVPVFRDGAAGTPEDERRSNKKSQRKQRAPERPRPSPRHTTSPVHCRTILCH